MGFYCVLFNPFWLGLLSLKTLLPNSALQSCVMSCYFYLSAIDTLVLILVQSSSRNLILSRSCIFSAYSLYISCSGLLGTISGIGAGNSILFLSREESILRSRIIEPTVPLLICGGILRLSLPIFLKSIYLLTVIHF